MEIIKKNSRGFTMIEIIVGMTVLTILAVIAVTIANVQGKDVDNIAKVMRSNIQFAQDLAMTHGRVYGFRAITTTTYEIYESTPGMPAKDPLTNRNMSYDISPIQFFGGMQSVIQFSATGSAAITGGDGTLKLTDGSQQRYLQVEPNTGFVLLKYTP